jgi:hypothetical protein
MGHSMFAVRAGRGASNTRSARLFVGRRRGYVAPDRLRAQAGVVPRRRLGFVGKLGDLYGATGVRLGYANLASRCAPATFGTTAFRFCVSLTRNSLGCEFNPPRDLFIAFQRRQFGAVAELAT